MTPYNGGKSGTGTYQQIINHIPPHDIYIEPMAGHCGIYRKIRPAAIAILNDVDKKVADDIFNFLITKNGIDVSKDFFQGSLFEKPSHPIVIVRNNDYSVIMDRFKDNPDAFIYCDPPYPLSARSSQRLLYKYNWEREDQHEQFLQLANQCKCRVMISSYPNPIYEKFLAPDKWTRHLFFSVKRNSKKALEVIYMNYQLPEVLHDFQYLGKNFREREKIKRKVTRTIGRLNRMAAVERSAIISAIVNQYKSTTETLIKL